MQSPNRISPAPKIIAAAIVSIAGLAWCQTLLTSGRVNQLSFVSLAAVVVLTGLFIAFSDRIKILNLRQLSIELERIEEARKDVEEREARVRRIAHIVSEITLFFAAFQNRCLGDGDSERQRAWHEAKVTELLRTTAATPEERSTVFQLFEAVKRMDEQRESLDPDERERRWEDIHQRIQNEINRMA